MRTEADHGGDAPKLGDGSSADAGTLGGAPLFPPGVRFELIMLVVFSGFWLFAALGFFGILPVAGTLDLGLYRLYSVAAVLGWVSGNVYMMRRRVLPNSGRWKNRLLLAYLLGPSGVVYMLRALASPYVQKAAPLVPIYGFGVYIIFFLVPVTLKSSEPPRLRP